MDTYNTIKINQDGIKIAKIIRSVCHLQENDKQDVMVAVETNKQVYLFYQAFHQSNMDYMEAFKSDLKLSEAHNGAVGYYPDLYAAALL